jgi:preprotein translocase subunit SecE
MAKSPSANAVAQRRKAAPSKPVASGKANVTAAPAVSVAPKKRTTPMQFWNEVRAEARKTTWTSWKETWITSVMVGIMVVLTAVFFLIVDGALNVLIQQLLKLASG